MHKQIRVSDLVPVRMEIEEALAKYQLSKGVQSAVHLASDLMNYEAHPSNRSARQMVEQFERLKAHGVTPWDLLQRVVETYAVIDRSPRGRFENADVERITLRAWCS